MLISGRCHCGNISFALDWQPEPSEIPARACTCSFCAKHGGVWTSVFFLGAVQALGEELYGAPPPDIDARIEALVKSYPDWISGRDGNFLVMKDGRKCQISDGKSSKTFAELLAEPDIDNMFYMPYPVGSEPKQPAKNSDPGRVRFEPLFLAMYGDCEKNEVTKHLRAINWLPKHPGGRVSVTRVNGVDHALDAVSKELDELPVDMMKYLKPTSGTYNCRLVVGSNRRSMHGYGVAIDINANYSNYWRWIRLHTRNGRINSPWK
jgi:hypothetical protein